MPTFDKMGTQIPNSAQKMPDERDAKFKRQRRHPLHEHRSQQQQQPSAGAGASDSTQAVSCDISNLVPGLINQT